MTATVLEFPLQLGHGLNERAHWAVKAKRVKRERTATALAWLSVLGTAHRPSLPVVVTLTRIAPRELDAHDNLRASLKGVVDEVTRRLGLENDRSPLVEWRYAQERGGVREYRVRVEIERRG